MTDGQGRTVDFKNTVIVMTSNIGSHEIQRLSSDPATNRPDLIKEAVMDEVKQSFRPEFVNRIDEIVVFHALDQKNIQSIARIQLRNLEQRLVAHDMSLTVTEAALEEIAKAGFDPIYGARPLKRAIQQKIENPVARLVLEGRFGPKDVIPVDFRNGEFVFERVVH
jgi:ATP-dependent Clp protease ATP-binding subunit ClpB